MHDSLGPKNVPQYSGTGAPADAADLTEVAAYAAIVGNMKTGTNAVRVALSGADVWDGLMFVETDTKIAYLRVTGTWVPWLSAYMAYTPTFGGVVLGSGGSASAKWKYEPGRVRVTAVITFGSGLTYPTIPTMSLPVTLVGGTTLFEFDGVITYQDTSAGASGQFSGRIGSVSGDLTKIRFLGWPSSTGNPTATSAVAPFTWASGDQIFIDFSYPIN